MYKIIGSVTVLLALVGCATPHQNAALAGAVAGAVVASSVYTPYPPPKVNCYSTIYIDQYGNRVRRTTCR